MINSSPTIQPLRTFFAGGPAVDVLKLQEVHPVVSGNKWYKLKYYLQEAVERGYTKIITRGGPYSNHIIATAWAARELGLGSIGIIRGLAAPMLSPTLQDAQAYGMTLRFTEKNQFANFQLPESETASALYIPEGGVGRLGIQGAAEILSGIDFASYTHILGASGTGTMITGLATMALPHQQVLGISVLNNAPSPFTEISEWLKNWPTVITTVPNIPNNAMNPYQYNTTQVINYVPMINLRLPLSVNDNTPIALEDSLEQVQIINENGVLVTRQTNFMYSNGVLIFYVDRRSNIIETSKQITFGMRLPTATAGYERLNKRRVTYKYRLQFKNDVYVLRSVVVSDTSDIDEKDNLIIGSSTIITTEQTSVLDRPSDAIKYDPYGVIKSTVHNAIYNKYNGEPAPTPIAMQEAVNPRTISQIPYTYSDDGAVSFEDMAQCNGIIFVYQLKEDKSKGEIMA